MIPVMNSQSVSPIIAALLLQIVNCRTPVSGRNHPVSTTENNHNQKKALKRAVVVSRCLDQVDKALNTTDIVKSSGVWTLFTRCMTESKSILKPSCERAWATTEVNHLEQQQLIARVCKDAYCPQFTAPKPQLCTSQITSQWSPSRFPQAWTEFHLRVLMTALSLERDPALLARLSFLFTSISTFSLTPKVPITLPKHPSTMKQPKPDLHIYLKKDGTCVLNGKVVPINKLTAVLQEKHRQFPDADIVINADKKALYENVVHVIDIAKAAGFLRFKMIAEQKN